MVKVFGWLIALALLVVGGSFSLLNTTDVMVDYFFAKHEVPLAILLIIFMILGAILAAALLSFKSLGLRNEIRRLNREKNAAEAEVANLRNLPIKDNL